MGENSKIQWTDNSWSPWRGCTKVSEGCAHCYAETLSYRNPAVLGEWGKGKPRVYNKDWKQPLKWDRKAAEEKDLVGNLAKIPKIFPSLCDWLDDEVPLEWSTNFLRLMHDTPNLDWLLLTKRPELFAKRMQGSPLPDNVWHGVSVENQKRANERIPALLRTSAKIRWLSVEPLLGPVDLVEWLAEIDWVVVGGESGNGARPCHLDWVWMVLKQCKEFGVPVFMKQFGAEPVLDTGRFREAFVPYPLKDPKGGNMEEWPVRFRVRQMPKTERDVRALTPK